ncbi:MAG: CHASE2 domain-containing protein, partial [Paracoccaceae bacterium]
MARTDRAHRRARTPLAILFVVAMAALSGPDAVREAAFDRMLRTTPAPDDRAITVVAIDTTSLARIGTWPWPRDRLGALVESIGAGHPSVIVLDLVLQGPGSGAGASDPDAALIAAIAAHPVVLSALLEGNDPAPSIQPPPLLATGTPARLHLWHADGATWPFARAAKGAAGIGIASLAGDRSGLVRDVPVLVAVRGLAHPGLAAEAVRVAEGASAYIIAGQGAAAGLAGRMTIGEVSVAVPALAALRFRPSPAADWPARTVSAADVLAGGVPAGRFAGQIVLIGGTAPDLGTLRPTAASPVTPGVQIQTDAIAAIRSGTAPLRPGVAWGMEVVARALFAAAGLLLGWRLPPGRSIAAACALSVLWVAGSLALLHSLHWLIDPLSPVVAGLAATLIAATASATTARHHTSAVIARFRQHLAPEIVDRIALDPGQSRVEGERRVVTFLFTDIEGFTA